MYGFHNGFHGKFVHHVHHGKVVFRVVNHGFHNGNRGFHGESCYEEYPKPNEFHHEGVKC